MIRVTSYLEFLGMMEASGPIDSNITMLKYREITSLAKYRNVCDGRTCDRGEIKVLHVLVTFDQ